MKRVLISLAALGAVLSAKAEIEILYLAPNDTAPVLGSISSESDAIETATPVEGKKGWMEIVRKDYYSGFIAKDSLTPEGTVEIGTSMLMTPSKSGKVLTTIEAGDEVSINLVDDWTEITVNKAIPGYFIPADSKVTPPAGAGMNSNRRVTYASDPLLARAGQTRYSPETPSLSTSTSGPVAARPTIPTSEPMTGFEEVDSLNPTFGRTSDSGQTRGYSLGAGSTPIPERDTTAPFEDASMQAPTSVAAIPIPTAEDPDPTIEAPTQAEEVDTLSETEDADIEQTPDEPSDIEPVEDPELPMAAANEAGAEGAQESAMENLDEGTEEMVGEEGASSEDLSNEEDSDSNSEVIPLAPAAAVTGSAAAAAGSAAASTEASKPAAEVVETTPAVIVETEEDVEVSNDVAESVVPGVTQPMVPDEPPLIPPTDTNRVYIGRLERTSKGFWGSKPKYDFELLNYSGDRIAYVDISEVPMSSQEKFTEQIVQVYGVLVPTGEKDTLLIKAANITLR
ncbi:hypothetical protein [Puniceicoccus vermicola]|uniref:SH3 domain-containing protein n=1 Tax=Puniceicoccus vermicola TaxID=388746 RepID=A0A7X1AWZ1_9BACT|nr:hypothetical protein [Puniceicoccus vermicola]MBC2601553.1 hypothetical protein [Puniceicoccus vermicola]